MDALKRASKEGGTRVNFNPGFTPIGLRTINWAKSLGLPGFLGILYIGAFNFRYTVFLCLKLGIKYSLTTKVYRGFLNFGILPEF